MRSGSAIGVLTALAIWLGSATAAEAQQSITPIGQTSVTAGATSSTYIANVTLPVSCGHWIKVWVYKNDVLWHYSNNFIPNPGRTSYTYQKVVDMTAWAPNTGDVLVYKARLTVSGVSTDAADWTITVSGTYPQTFHARPEYKVQLGGEAVREDMEHDSRRVLA